MAIDYAALATEVQLPAYAALRAAGNDQGIADALNAVQAGITIRRQDIAPREVLAAIDLRDLIANPAQVANAALAASWFESVTQGEATIQLSNPDGTDSLLKDNLDRLLGNTNGSQTRFNAVARRDGSRAEQLFGAGTTIGNADVARALGRG